MAVVADAAAVVADVVADVVVVVAAAVTFNHSSAIKCVCNYPAK